MNPSDFAALLPIAGELVVNFGSIILSILVVFLGCFGLASVAVRF